LKSLSELKAIKTGRTGMAALMPGGLAGDATVRQTLLRINITN
jgi:hypothetical protein